MNFPLKTILLCALAIACTSAKKAHPQAPKPAEWVTWDKPSLELGQVKKGEKRSFFYEMTNTTAADVQVEIIDACDCTTVEFPRSPIAPGGKGRFDIVFNSAEKDESETIEIRIIWKQKDAAGNPRFDVLKYHYELLK